MASGQCDFCGVEEYMPYVCKFCKGRFCAAHRLPENHACQGLGAYRERVRAEGRPFAAEPGTPLQPQVAASARARMNMDAFWSKVQGRMTMVILGVSVATFLLQMVVLNAAGPALHRDIFVIGPDFLMRPWSVVTSIFAHGDLNHLLFNMIFLFFFGQSLEGLIGTRRFTYLYLGAGAVAGVVQVVVFNLLFDIGSGAVGASGALQGLMGTLVVLAPRLTVLVFFVIPAPLWALAAFYVAYDLLTAFGAPDGVAHFAHLAGFAVGAAFGYYLRKQGMRVMTRPPPSPLRRQF